MGADFVIADIPGLIEGAHEGAGIGDRFLGHVERCRVLLHLVDGTGEDVAEAYRTVRDELVEYGHGLAEKDEIVALSKADAIDPDELPGKVAALKKAAGRKPLTLSAVAGTGVQEALRAVVKAIATDKEAEAEREAVPAAPWRP